jgi:hypothetical protein
MSNFIDEEAELDEDSARSETSEPVAKRPKKQQKEKKKRQQIRLTHFG